jgi:putative two-component system response regulator
MFPILEKIQPDLILLDIEMPGMSGYEVIEILKNEKNTADIPVIFVTAHIDPESEVKGLSMGAIDYITKPFSF